MTITVDHLDYLQRVDPRIEDLGRAASARSVAPALRGLIRVEGVGRVEADAGPAHQGSKPAPFPEESLLVGLCGHRLPLAFVVEAREGEMHVSLGTWIGDVDGSEASVLLEQRRGVVEAGLRGAHAKVELAEAAVPTGSFSAAGLVLGAPAVRAPAPGMPLPWDRLLRGMAGGRWRVTVLAQPVADSVVLGVRGAIAEEMRQAEAAGAAQLANAPLAKHYQEMLKHKLEAISFGLSGGFWRTAVYLQGDDFSYHRLAALWKGVFSGDAPTDVLGVWDAEAVADLAARWVLPDDPGLPGPGRFRRILRYQSLLSSRQLGAYVHLPRFEYLGFSANTLQRFDVNPPKVGADGHATTVKLGRVRGFSAGNEAFFRDPFGGTGDEDATGGTEGDVADAAGAAASPPFRLPLDTLVRHVFVAGATGSGKTNTLHVLLEQLAASSIPFLVLEPAKTEYRKLMRSVGDVRIFTPGNEGICPIRLNPFEAVGGAPVSVHIDLLRSAFSAAFGMWTPLPQVLERCLHEVYQDRGWDSVSDENPRLDPGARPESAWPTLGDLIAKVDEVAPRLGYEDKIAANVRAALKTRLMALTAGGKGRMLDCESSTPVSEIFDRPAIVELEHIGDDEDKALIMGLLLIRLVEHRRAEPPPAQEELRHFLVVEEAHRLLSGNGPTGSKEEGDARGRAVEAFVNLLAEVRSHGQGIAIADQVPTKLHPDVIKNTNLKIAHRIVAADDRAALGAAMALSTTEHLELARLGLGETLVYSQHDDYPVMVIVPPARNASLPVPSAEEVRAAGPDPDRVFGVREGLADLCARRAVADPWFTAELDRFVLSMAEAPGTVPRVWDDLLHRIYAHLRSPVTGEELALRVFRRAADAFAQDHGRRLQWPYSATDDLGRRLWEVFECLLGGGDAGDAVEAFRGAWSRLHEVDRQPFVACGQICIGGSTCRYRVVVQRALDRSQGSQGPTHLQFLRDALRRDAQQDGAELAETWSVCRVFTEPLVLDDVPELAEAGVRVGLCYAQQLLVSDLIETQRLTLSNLVETARQTGHSE